MTRVLLFDPAAGCWLQFEEPRQAVVVRTLPDVVPALARLEQEVNSNGLFAAGFIAYEAAPAFDNALRVRTPPPDFPLVWFGLFENPVPVRLPAPARRIPLQWRPTISREEYEAAIAAIKKFIANGDTYQVNYSFRLTTPLSSGAYDLFLQLMEVQQSENAAFIETDEFAICSASPELFFALDGEKIAAKPMKGTVPRGLTVTQDAQQSGFLRTSEKNRAENVMIVDMMRNDLGRIAETGSVRVPSLFDVQRYPTLWQMTSTVEAMTRAPVVEILRALFPCASVTGAPKARTMQIIAGLEARPRKVYTGAIGFLAPGRRARFNVAIRTVLIDKNREEAEYGVGGGIVWASTSEDEYAECLTKARLLTAERPVFELFETMLFRPGRGIFLLEGHCARLQSSAEYFDYPHDASLLNDGLARLQSELAAQPHEMRVRLTLHRDGKPSFTVQPVAAPDRECVRVKLAASSVDSQNPFLYHKTTHRVLYDEALASVSGCDDVILWNERGEITESTIANVVVDIGGELFTPPVECGLLAGTFREKLLREGMVKERVITQEEFRAAPRAFLINSVRQWRELTLVG